VLRRHRGIEVRLSNETTLTRWAYAQRALPVRSAPQKGASTVTRLRFASNQHARQVYIFLSGLADAKGKVWVHVRVPGRPNGRTGWVQSSGFYRPTVNRLQLIVDRGSLRATLYRSGQKVFRAPVGVGTPSTPTPGGHFVIEKKNGPIFGPVFGTHVLFTNAFSSLEDWPGGGLVGMHGTNEPNLVPGRPSHGCIRLHNADINRLYALIRVGTPLWIR
jgi:hypothetical protein